MIKLINGFEVEYNEDFDKFFQNMLEAHIQNLMSKHKRQRQLKLSHICHIHTESRLELQNIH